MFVVTVQQTVCTVPCFLQKRCAHLRTNARLHLYYQLHPVDRETSMSTLVQVNKRSISKIDVISDKYLYFLSSFCFMIHICIQPETSWLFTKSWYVLCSILKFWLLGRTFWWQSELRLIGNATCARANTAIVWISPISPSLPVRW